MILGSVTDWLAESVWPWLTGAIGKLGYTGIVALMALESSFFPFPSEVVIPPAAANARAGTMSLLLVIAAGILGSLIGALFNYWIAVKLGRPFLIKYGKYVFISPKAFAKSEEFFRRHGEIGTFIGRLVPGVRQVISFPAGLARMHLGRFCFFTVLGSSIWVVILALVGFWVGAEPETVKERVVQVFLYLLPALVVILLLYVGWRRFRRPPPQPIVAGDEA